MLTYLIIDVFKLGVTSMEFMKCFNETEPVPAEGIENALRLMEEGSLYRYNNCNIDISSDSDKSFEQEDGEAVSELARLEKEFCNYTGHKYAVGVNSCGSAMFLALKAVGVRKNDKVFTNSFTFTAVPSSIVHAGGVPIYVECDRRYVIDLGDLEEKIRTNPDVKYFLLSYMRGHISDLDRIKELCDAAGICLIEDCAHGLGAQWYDEQSGEHRHLGHHGRAACFSTQSYKMLIREKADLSPRMTEKSRHTAYWVQAHTRNCIIITSQDRPPTLSLNP